MDAVLPVPPPPVQRVRADLAGLPVRRLVERFALTRVARKVVGVGSVGTETWILLLEPDDGFDSLLLQAKQAQRLVLADYAGQSGYRNQGERVVAGQHLMQAVSGASSSAGRGLLLPGRRSADFYFRQLRDWKYSAEIVGMNAAAMTGYGRMCGWTLRPRPRPDRGPDRDRRLPQRVGQVRPRRGRIRRDLCRPDRTRPHGTGQRGRLRARAGPGRHLSLSGLFRYLTCVQG